MPDEDRMERFERRKKKGRGVYRKSLGRRHRN